MGHLVDDDLPATLHSNLVFQRLLFHFIFQPSSIKCDLTERLNIRAPFNQQGHHFIAKKYRFVSLTGG